MVARKHPTGKVRPSRDGHEYHEAWTARKAMQLFWPDSDLSAISVEGLSPRDQKSASAATADIADIACYYGSGTTFERASRVTVVQFKYSVASRHSDFRASHAKKTIEKFAETFRKDRKRYGAQAVKDKLYFELLTNQPIYKPLEQAIRVLAKGQPTSGEVGKQAQQFKRAAGLEGKLLAAFAAKCEVLSLSDDLSVTKDKLSGQIVDWSAAKDLQADARLGKLRQMVRDKAGSVGSNRNLITREDLLICLGISEAADLLPCPTALAEIGQVVEREQLGTITELIPNLTKPLLVHAAGGVGKTVLLDSVAKAASEKNETVFFDCFGGGAYRSPEDGRHLPQRGLIHIANTLAFKGMCDPIIPGLIDTQSLMTTFRRRLIQCVHTLKRYDPDRGLVLIVDAIDNAELFARERDEESFPILLLESFHQSPVAGVKLIVACRTERKPTTFAEYQEFPLQPFSINETAAYLQARLKNISEAEIKVAQVRSGGNPRVLEYLQKSNRGLLEKSEINKKVELDELIQDRITQALSVTVERGYKEEDINAFLAGLAVLPPPVPLDEYACAQGFAVSAIESFASDLSPLLERTNQGLTFRDEPTETLVRDKYASSEDSLRRVANNLMARQAESVYSARALPSLLHRLGYGEQLFNLAFDDRMPAQITSTVGKRDIRYARIKAAVLYAAVERDNNHLVQLLLELSTIASVDQRGANYILDYPDLVVVAQDVDALRRLFETRTGWPGTRHARLAITNSLSGDSESAYRHAIATNDWIEHFRRSDRDDRSRDARPERPDIAAIPFFLLCEGRPEEAVRFLQGWRDWYSYRVCEYVLDYFQLATSLQPLSPRILTKFVSTLKDIGPLTAALSFLELAKRTRKSLVVKLSLACKKTTKLDLADAYQYERTYELEDGLRKASALALSLGLPDAALAISLRAPHRRPDIWALNDNHYHKEVFPFVFRAALVAAAKNKTLHEKDVIPKKLVPLCSRIKRDLTDKEFRNKVKERLHKYVRKENDKDGAKKDPRTFSYNEKQEAERFIDLRLQPLLSLTKALSGFLAASPQQTDKAFIELLKTWEITRKNRDYHQTAKFDNLFCKLGHETALFALWARSELKPSSVKRFLETLQGQYIGAHMLTQIVSILAQRESLHLLAGEQALLARKLIEAEDDVTHRASLFASLGRAMLPANPDDASVYFRDGLEQLDAIGSGDWEFTNELLLFASAMKGEELEESDFHTLTNICELNTGDDPEKFFWEAFAKGMSKAAGPRGLAKLSRWDDRTKIGLENTLLPYLTALVDDGKIEPELALALNRLASPAEHHEFGTKAFAKAIHGNKRTIRPEIISELIEQFEDNNPGYARDSTVEVLAALAEETFGSSSETTVYLSTAYKRFANVRDIINDQMNYRGRPNARMRKRASEPNFDSRAALETLAAATDPTDQGSLAEAIESLNNLQNAYELKAGFFASLRSKVPTRAHAKYVRDICALEDFGLYGKLEELLTCKEDWGKSSAALSGVLKTEAVPLTRLHADDLISHGQLSGYKLKEISDLTGTTITELVHELIKVFARPDSSVPGAVWLAFASFVCPEADEGQGQVALNRLLRSDAGKLANNVADGAWQGGLYPKDDICAIAGGLVWRMLGSPLAKDRWRACHSIRCLANFGRWDIVGTLVGNLSEETAGPFQADELTFYYLHARLWLLIALARIALDHPKEIARYKDQLLRIATEEDAPHVLMRHFSAQALHACLNGGNLKIPANVEKQLRAADSSPHPLQQERNGVHGGPYERRPNSLPEPKFDFDLDYDFLKNDVDSLSRVFGKPCWEVNDKMSEICHQLDPSISSMYETGGRETDYSQTSYRMSTRYHSYGQQLGWHALFLAAGALLKTSPLASDQWSNDPWGDWLGHYTLTRDDGFWLSDGIDRPPLDAAQTLLEKAKDGLAITGDRDKLVKLAGLTSRVGRQLVVDGYWHSPDGIRVHISSALVSPGKAAKLGRKLMREEPMSVWLPSYDEDEGGCEYISNKKSGYTPWIVRPDGWSRLDENDPFGASCANLRPRIARDYALPLSLTTNDRFNRAWQGKRGTVAVRAHAWRYKDEHVEGDQRSGLRLLCSASTLKQILKKHDKDLLVLISLSRYEKKGYQGDSKYTHTVAGLRITRTLDIEYFKGRINHLYKPRY